jgi:type IV pilus assembly protein PilV
MILTGDNGFTKFASSDGSIALGTGDAYADCTGFVEAKKILCDWGMSLKGASEIRNTSDKVGALIGARGCIIGPVDSGLLPAPVQEFFLVIVWQGLAPETAPTPGTPGALCASGVNFGAGQRRSVSTRVLIPKLID